MIGDISISILKLYIWVLDVIKNTTWITTNLIIMCHSWMQNTYYRLTFEIWISWAWDESRLRYIQTPAPTHGFTKLIFRNCAISWHSTRCCMPKWRHTTLASKPSLLGSSKPVRGPVSQNKVILLEGHLKFLSSFHIHTHAHTYIFMNICTNTWICTHRSTHVHTHNKCVLFLYLSHLKNSSREEHMNWFSSFK